MSKIRFLFRRLKDYLAERSRVRQLKAGTRTLISLQMMEARTLSYIVDLEAKVRAQAHVIRTQQRDIQSANMAAVDAELDLRAEQNGRQFSLATMETPAIRDYRHG